MLKFIVMFVLLIIGIAFYQYFNSLTLKNYCIEHITGHDYKQVNVYVAKENLYLHQKLDKNTSRAVINNHASPFFRMACFIELKSGVVKNSKYGSGD